MKINQPISNVEVPFTQGIIVTQTNLKGIITYANDQFVELSGFSREELVGKNHNVVRHPEMPPLLFQDLWDTVKAGKCWRGIVKNRCKNGDHYWVDAFVVPVKHEGETRGYMSVRTPASRSAIQHAEASYPALMQAKKLHKPKMQGRLLARLQSSYLVLINLLLFVAAWFDEGMIGAVIAGLGILTTAGFLLLNRSREQHQNRLLTACLNIAEGKLTNKLDIDRAGEQGQLEAALAYMQVHLKVMLDELQMTARAQANETASIQQRIEDLCQRMEAGNENVREVSAAVEELSSSIEIVAQNADDTARISHKTGELMQTSTNEMNTSRERTLAASQAVEQAQNIIANLS